MSFKVINSFKVNVFGAALVVMTSAYAQSPYISKVYEYRPAPGQFVNDLPEWEEGDDENDMRIKAEECLVDHEQIMISLGGWGGYVVFGFDHTIPNVKGQYDMKILGNAFYANANPNDTTALGGSAEPGIVMVSHDANGNGRPDDAWYELAGSDYYKSTTKHNYSCTYYRPSASHVATPDTDYPYLNDTTYIRWEDNYGESGYISKNIYHKQNYYPNWIEEDSYTLTGSRLRNNGIDESGTGHYYVLYCFDWGYVDNQPNTSGYTATDEVMDVEIPHVSEFMIDWAVDSEGNHVDLPGVDFVKVYTGVNQYNGWLGEASTEVMDAWDLHMLDADGKEIPAGIRDIKGENEDEDGNNHKGNLVGGIFTLDGRRVEDLTKPGTYIIKGRTKTKKIVVR